MNSEQMNYEILRLLYVLKKRTKGNFNAEQRSASEALNRLLVIVTKGRFGTATWEGSKRQTIGD